MTTSELSVETDFLTAIATPDDWFRERAMATLDGDWAVYTSLLS